MIIDMLKVAGVAIAIFIFSFTMMLILTGSFGAFVSAVF